MRYYPSHREMAGISEAFVASSPTREGRAGKYNDFVEQMFGRAIYYDGDGDLFFIVDSKRKELDILDIKLRIPAANYPR